MLYNSNIYTNIVSNNVKMFVYSLKMQKFMYFDEINYKRLLLKNNVQFKFYYKITINYDII